MVKPFSYSAIPGRDFSEQLLNIRHFLDCRFLSSQDDFEEKALFSACSSLICVLQRKYDAL